MLLYSGYSGLDECICQLPIPKDRLSFSQAALMHSKWQSELFQTKCCSFCFHMSMRQRRHLSIVPVICVGCLASFVTNSLWKLFLLWNYLEFAFVPSFHFYRTQVYLGSDLWVQVSLTEGRFWNYTSYTSYTSYRLQVIQVIQFIQVIDSNLQGMQVAPSGGQFCN